MDWQPFSVFGVLTNAAVSLLYPGGPMSAMTRIPVGWQPAGEVTCLVEHIRLMNNHSAPLTVQVGITTNNVAAVATTAAFFPLNRSIPAVDFIDWYGEVLLHGSNAGHYITGLGSTTNLITYHIEGLVGVS